MENGRFSFKSEDMEAKSRYKTRESFISELAFAMSNHDIQDDQYLNLTQQNLSVIQREDYSWGKKWPAEGDEVIFVDKTPSWEAFHQMEEFAESIADDRITRKLYNALDRRHPFTTFRNTAKRIGVIQQWYQWCDRWQNEKAEEWMRDNGVNFKDGRIVADGKHVHIWSWEDEEDYR